MRNDDPFRVLGLGRDASPDEIRAARRRLAKHAHPDLGGSAAQMQRLNEAAREALAEVERADESGRSTRRGPGRYSAAQQARWVRRFGPQRLASDNPSFVIEALPAVAFEGLKVAVSALGSLLDEDPPYLLEVRLDDPIVGWCRLHLTSEAGSSTVALEYAPIAGYPIHSIETVRDALVAELNQLDWEELSR